MIEVEIHISSTIKPAGLIKIVEQVCMENDLVCSLKGTLAAYPGCIHWHFRKVRQSGTLEITWWEKKHRLWFKVAENRTGTWLEEMLPALKRKIEGALLDT